MGTDTQLLQVEFILSALYQEITDETKGKVNKLTLVHYNSYTDHCHLYNIYQVDFM